MFGDIQPIGDLINRIFNIENAFFIEVQPALSVLCIIRDIPGISDLFYREFLCLSHPVIH